MELNSENERTEPDQAEAGGFSVGGVTANIPTRPTSPTRSATSLSKREKLFQLLQKLPRHKKRRKVRRCGGKRGSGSGLCGKNVKKSSLRGEVERFADLFEFHRKQQRVIPKGSKRPNIGARGRGARKASAGEKSASMPQKVNKSSFVQLLTLSFQVRRVWFGLVWFASTPDTEPPGAEGCRSCQRDNEGGSGFSCRPNSLGGFDHYLINLTVYPNYLIVDPISWVCRTLLSSDFGTVPITGQYDSLLMQIQYLQILVKSYQSLICLIRDPYFVIMNRKLIISL